MAKNFQPNDHALKNLAKEFERSIVNNNNQFFLEDELERLMEYYEVMPNNKMALLVADRAVNLFPYSGAFHSKRAQCLIIDKQYVEAQEALEQAKVFDPLSSEITLLEADLCTAQGKYNEAVILLEQLLDMVDSMDKVDVFLELADVYEIAGDTKNLLLTLKSIANDFPSNEEAIHRLWNVIYETKQIEQEIQTFTNLIDKKPYQYLAWYYLAKSYERLGLYEKAIEAYEYTIAINDYYFAYWDYALCHKKLKQYTRAIHAFQDFIDVFADEYDSLIEIGVCYLKLSQFETAREYFIKAKELADTSKENGECYALLAESYQYAENIPLAILYYRKAIDETPKRARLWRELGSLYAQEQDYENAIQYLEHSLQLSPKQQSTWTLLLEVLSNHGSKELLFQYAQETTRRYPHVAKVNYMVAGHLLRNGYRQYGLLVLQNAASADKNKVKKFLYSHFPELQEDIHVVQIMNQENE